MKISERKRGSWILTFAQKSKQFAIVGFLIVTLGLAGCSKRTSEHEEFAPSPQMNEKAILGGEEGTYPNLSALLGHITYKDLLGTLNKVLLKINILNAREETSSEDYQNLYELLKNVRTAMLEAKADHEASGEEQGSASAEIGEASNAMSGLFHMLARNHVGKTLNQLIRQTGPDLHVEPMLAYALATDESLITNILNGIQWNGIDRDDFSTLVVTVNGLLDPAGRYSTLHDDLGDTITSLKTNEIQNLTIDDAKALAASVWSGLAGSTADVSSHTAYPVENKEFINNVLWALEDLWENDPQFRDDLVTILAEIGKLMSVQEDGDTDLGKVVTGLLQLLSPGDTRRDHLRQYVTSLLHGIAPISDEQTLSALIEKITWEDMDNDGIPDTMNDYSGGGIGNGLVSFVTRNQYNQDRQVYSVKTSALRSLFFLLQEANQSLTLLGIPMLSLVTSPDGGTVSNETTNVAQWTVGEVATALRWARAWNMNENDHGFMAAADTDGNGYVDALEAFDWLLYTKRYRLMGIGIPGFTQYNGLVDTLTDFMIQGLVPVSIADSFAAFVELAGGIAATGEGASIDAYKNRKGTAGQRHELFSLFVPIFDYFWDPNSDGDFSDRRVADLLNVVISLNEIGVQADQNPYITYSLPYKSLYTCLGAPCPNGVARPDATFRTDASGDILKTLDGGDSCDGGLIAYLLRSHDGTSEDGIILDKALDLVVRMIAKLDSDQYLLSNGKTAYRGLVEKLNIQPLTEDKINTVVADLFDGENGEQALIDTVYDLLVDNHEALVNIAKPLGVLLVNVSRVNSETGSVNVVSLINDCRTCWSILKDTVTIGDLSDNSFADYIEYLGQKNPDGSDNVLIANVFTLLNKILDLQDALYNPAGPLEGNTPLTGPDGFLVHLFGGSSSVDSLMNSLGFGDGLYDLSPIRDFLVEATADPDALWENLSNGGGFMSKILGNTDAAGYEDIEISFEFLRAMLTQVDFDYKGTTEEGSVLSELGGMVYLGDVDFNGVFEDAAKLLALDNVDLRPGSKDFDALLDILDYVIENTTVH